MLHKVGVRGLWISTIAILLFIAVQGFSGNWATFFLVWMGSGVSNSVVQASADLAAYHIIMGFAIGILSILILIFAFLSRSNLYVRILAVFGFLITGSAIMGGVLYVTSMFKDRLSLGQMADSFVGAFAAYFLMMFFMNKVPRFPWNKTKGD